MKTNISLLLCPLILMVATQARAEAKCEFDSFLPGVQARAKIVGMLENAIPNAVVQFGDSRNYDSTPTPPVVRIECACQQNALNLAHPQFPIVNFTTYTIRVFAQVSDLETKDIFELDTTYRYELANGNPAPSSVVFAIPPSQAEPMLYSFKESRFVFPMKKVSSFRSSIEIP